MSLNEPLPTEIINRSVVSRILLLSYPTSLYFLCGKLSPLYGGVIGVVKIDEGFSS
jgi:hypothetical protein